MSHIYIGIISAYKFLLQCFFFKNNVRSGRCPQSKRVHTEQVPAGNFFRKLKRKNRKMKRENLKLILGFAYIYSLGQQQREAEM